LIDKVFLSILTKATKLIAVKHCTSIVFTAVLVKDTKGIDMTVGSIAGAGGAVPAAPARSERVETRENDGDGDDAKGASAPSRSVNLNGQTTGTTIHAVA